MVEACDIPVHIHKNSEIAYTLHLTIVYLYFTNNCTLNFNI